MGITPYFFGELMKTGINFKSLEEAITCYGRENLIPIDNLKQAIFYVQNGCQPRFIWEKEGQEGRVTFWFLKTETSYIYRQWMRTKPN